jgi:hypothetical protein
MGVMSYCELRHVTYVLGRCLSEVRVHRLNLDYIQNTLSHVTAGKRGTLIQRWIAIKSRASTAKPPPWGHQHARSTLQA